MYLEVYCGQMITFFGNPQSTTDMPPLWSNGGVDYRKTVLVLHKAITIGNYWEQMRKDLLTRKDNNISEKLELKVYRLVRYQMHSFTTFQVTLKYCIEIARYGWEKWLTFY